MPVVLLVSAIGVIVAPVQIGWLDGIATTFGVGLTTTVAVIAVPRHPSADGVMVKVTVMGAVVLLVRVPVIFPVPLVVIVPPIPVIVGLVHV